MMYTVVFTACTLPHTTGQARFFAANAVLAAQGDHGCPDCVEALQPVHVAQATRSAPASQAGMR